MMREVNGEESYSEACFLGEVRDGRLVEFPIDPAVKHPHL